MKALQFSVSIPRYIGLKALGIMGRRLYYRGPLATVKLVDIPEPPLPSPEWIKIRTIACGLCGSDLNLIFLKDSPSASPFTSFPCVLGHELCGEIMDVGKQVRGLKTGDYVTIAPHLNCLARGITQQCAACRAGRPANCDNFARGSLAPGMFTGICRDTGGGFAQFLVAHQSQVFKLPPDMAYEEGAMIEPLAVSLQAVLDNRPSDGDSVLVIGAGVIGNLIIQCLRALEIDCTIAVVEPSAFHAGLAGKAGADQIISDGDIFSAATRFTGATRYKPMLGKDILMGGFSKIFDCVATSDTLNTSMRVLDTGGTLCVVGIGHDVKLDLTPLWLKLQTMKAAWAYGYTQVEGEPKHAFEIALDLVQAKKIELSSMVTHKFLLENFSDMIETNLSKSVNRVVKSIVFFK